MDNVVFDSIDFSVPYISQGQSVAHSIGNRVNAFAVFLHTPLFFSIDYLIHHYHYLVDPAAPLLWRVLTAVAKVFSMCLIVSSTPVGIGLCLLGKLFHRIGDALIGESYTLLEGAFKGEISKKYSSLTLNICMLPYGLPTFAGMKKSQRRRAQSIIEAILSKNPKFVCLQEVAAPMAHSLYGELQEHYHSFVLDVGKHDLNLESGLFFASKEPILRHFWRPFNNDWGIDRGLLIVETENDWLIATHLSAGNAGVGDVKRRVQFDAILKIADKLHQTSPKQIHLLGDLNAANAENESFQRFYDPYREEYPTLTDATATCTGLLAARLGMQEEAWESIDYALTYKPSINESFRCRSELVPMFNLENPDDANSDHNGIYTEEISELRKGASNTDG